MEYAIYVVLALVCLSVGYVIGRVTAPTRTVVVPVLPERRLPSPLDATNSPFVTCRFLTRDGVVVAEKRLRRESVSNPMLWGNVSYRLISSNERLSRRTYEREQ